MSRFLPIICVSVVGVALLAGCGGSSTTTSTASAPASTPAAGQGQVIHLSADPGGALRFTRSALTAKAGKVTLIMKNPSSAGMDHGIAIDGAGTGATVSPGSTSTVTATLKKGTYTYYCPVPGHRQAGMVGTLTVS
jgi:plastocyanin